MSEIHSSLRSSKLSMSKHQPRASSKRSHKLTSAGNNAGNDYSTTSGMTNRSILFNADSRVQSQLKKLFGHWAANTCSCHLKEKKWKWLYLALVWETDLLNWLYLAQLRLLWLGHGPRHETEQEEIDDRGLSSEGLRHLQSRQCQQSAPCAWSLHRRCRRLWSLHPRTRVLLQQRKVLFSFLVPGC